MITCGSLGQPMVITTAYKATRRNLGATHGSSWYLVAAPDSARQLEASGDNV